MRWIIINRLNPILHWSKVLGWVGRKACDVFTEQEAARVTLPLDGTWKRITLENGAS